jgi:tetratricopeptide (TPR) repeat protein
MKHALLKYSLFIALLLNLALSCSGPSRPVQENTTTSADNQTASAAVPPVETAGDNSSAENTLSTLLGADDYDRVIREANAALDGDPEASTLREKLADAYIARAWFYKVKRLNPYTLNDLSKAVEAAPKYYRAYYELGRFHNNQWQFSIGLLDLNKALSLKPDFAPAYNERGYSNYKNQKYEAALADVNKAIELDAADGQFYYLRSQVYTATGKNDLAISDLTTVLGLSKDISLTGKASADLLKLTK